MLNFRKITSLLPKTGFSNFIRPIVTTQVTNLKEIAIKQEKSTLVIEAAYVESPRANHLIPELIEHQQANKLFCPKCTLGLDIKHTDVLILSQYVRSNGTMLPRRITGLCKRQQKRIGTMVTMAQRAGLMPNLAPKWSKMDPKKRFEWKKYNKYYDESTIKF